MGNERRGRCFPMRAGDCYAVFGAHQFGKHEGAWDGGYAPFLSSKNFWICCTNRGGVDNNFNAVIEAAGAVVAFKNSATNCEQVLNARLLKILIASRDGVSLIAQDSGDATHPNATNADKMNMSFFIKHANSRCPVLENEV